MSKCLDQVIIGLYLRNNLILEYINIYKSQSVASEFEKNLGGDMEQKRLGITELNYKLKVLLKF